MLATGATRIDGLAQDGRHRDVGDGELTREIILAADRIVQSAEPALDVLQHGYED